DDDTIPLIGGSLDVSSAEPCGPGSTSFNNLKRLIKLLTNSSFAMSQHRARTMKRRTNQITERTQQQPSANAGRFAGAAVTSPAFPAVCRQQDLPGFEALSNHNLSLANKNLTLFILQVVASVSIKA